VGNGSTDRFALKGGTYRVGVTLAAARSWGLRLDGERSLPLRQAAEGARSRREDFQVLLPAGRYRLVVEAESTRWTATVVRLVR
jgi:hypothetical protein